MSGIMNNYFYGKAGQADYTVEQMPTNRKQLFFTTLKVRFSSMVGLNLLYFVFLIPLLVWMFLGFETLGIYMLDETTSEEYKARLAEIEPEVVANFDAYMDETAQLSALLEKYETQDAIYEILNAGSTVSYDVKDEEGNVTGTRDYSLAQFNELTENRVTHYTNYSNGLSAARNGNITTTLLIAIPLFVIASLGRPGMMYVLRNWAQDEHSFMWQDFKAAIKQNWKQAFVIGLFNGLSFFLFFIAWITYGEMANGSWFFAIPQGLMLVLLLVWWMMNEIIYVMMVTYEMNLRTLIKNSILIAIARLPIAFLILFGSVAVPVLLSLIPQPYGLLVMLIVYALIGFAFVGFVQASFANSCFDKYLNPRIEGAQVNKGIYTPDADEEEKQDEPEVLIKEDRYWEHKTK